MNPILPKIPKVSFIQSREELKEELSPQETINKKRKLSDYYSEGSTNTRKESLNESFTGLNINSNSSGFNASDYSINIPKPIRSHGHGKFRPYDFKNDHGKLMEKLFDFKLTEIKPFEKFKKTAKETKEDNTEIINPPNDKIIEEKIIENNKVNIPLCYFPFGMPIGKTCFTDLLKKNFEELKNAHIQTSNVQFVGPLTLEERTAKVNRYLEKKKNRKWKYVRYNVRKDLADQRQRVQGRFVKTNKIKFFPLFEQSETSNISFEEIKQNLSELAKSNGSV